MLSWKKQRSMFSLTQVGLIAVVVVLLNIFLQNVTWRWDITANKQYSLSTESKTILEHLDNPLTIKVYFSNDVPQNMLAAKRDLEDLLTEYQQVAGDGLTLTMVDPKTDTDYQTEVDSYGIPEIQYNTVQQEKFEVSTGYAGMVILYGDQHSVIPAIPNVQNIEYEITAAIQKMSQTNPPLIGWLSDHGTLAGEAVQAALAQQYTVEPVTLADLTTSAVNHLIIAGPTEEFTDDERYTIDQFVMHGGKLYVLLDSQTVNQQFLQTTPNQTGLEELLADYGITVEQNMLADLLSAETLTFGGGYYSVLRPYAYWPRLVNAGMEPSSPIVNQIQAFTMPWPASLNLAPQAGQTVTALVKTSPQTVAVQADSMSIDPDSVATLDSSNTQQYTVAALLSGTITSAYDSGDDYAAQTDQGAIFVTSNARFIDDALIGDNTSNAIILLNAVDVLAQEVPLVGIRARADFSRPLNPMSDAQKTITKYSNIFFSVIVVAVVAGLGYAWRKRKDQLAQQRYV